MSFTNHDVDDDGKSVTQSSRITDEDQVQRTRDSTQGNRSFRSQKKKARLSLTAASDADLLSSPDLQGNLASIPQRGDTMGTRRIITHFRNPPVVCTRARQLQKMNLMAQNSISVGCTRAQYNQ